jgi:DNA-binding SARP family transcriptional activator
VEYRVLGPLEVWFDGELVKLGGPRQRALLAMLLLSANRVVSRDRLVDELLGSVSADSVDRVLRVQISRLRKSLGDDGGGGSRIISRAPGYLLRVESGELDLERFESLLSRARAASETHDHARTAALLAEAESLWRGRPLADLEFEPFARIEVDRLEELRLVAAEERIDAELALGHHSRLGAELEAQVAAHPLREHLRGQVDAGALPVWAAGRRAQGLSDRPHRDERAAGPRTGSGAQAARALDPAPGPRARAHPGRNRIATRRYQDSTGAPAARPGRRSGAGEQWSRIDREITNRAPWLPLYNRGFRSRSRRELATTSTTRTGSSCSISSGCTDRSRGCVPL